MINATYFETLSAALKSEGLMKPTLVIDRRHLDANLDRLISGLSPDLALRIVDKSLPCLPLLDHILRKTGATRIMSFHLPITAQVLERFSQVDVLFGKPMPVASVQHAISKLSKDACNRLFSRTVFLIDTPERLGQYSTLASEIRVPIRIAFEIDVGMHRGGFENPEALSVALASIRSNLLLKCEGVMGYEAHIPSIPSLFGGSSFEQAQVKKRFDAFVAMLNDDQKSILNIGGSKTATTYKSGVHANEASVGSALVLPTDFDGGALQDMDPACFIATPILKVLDTRLPGPPIVTRAMQAIGRFPRRGCFLYGGKWMADPVYPEGMKANSLWGDSSNQQMMGLPDNSPAKVDDLAFFRPTQSEAVFQQFGAIAIYEDTKIVDFWQVMATG